MKDSFERSVFLQAKAVGLARDQLHFSQLCGRSPLWYSGIVGRGLAMGIAPLSFLLVNVTRAENACTDDQQRRAIGELRERIAAELVGRCERGASTHLPRPG